MSCPTYCDFATNFKVLKALLKDTAIVAGVRKLIGDETVTNYDALKVLVNSKLVALGYPNQRVIFVKEDGKYVFDNTKTFAESALVENHNTRPEVTLAWDWWFGVSATRGVPCFWKKNYQDCGYSVATRTSSTVGGSTSYYVAKVCARCPGATDPLSFSARVS